MLIGLGTGSVGTYELALRLGLPHEKHWLPWEVDTEKLEAALPEMAAQGGEVSLCFLPYVEAILERVPDAKFICMQRDQARVVRGLARKLGRNPFAIAEDAAGYHNAFPFYGPGLTLEEGAARFYRDYYERAYYLQRRYPQEFRVFFTDYLLTSPAEQPSQQSMDRLVDLCACANEDFEEFSGLISRGSRRAA